MPILTPIKLYKDIDLAFTSHPQTGDVVKKIDVNSIKQALKILLFTSTNERPFRDDITGFTALRSMLFEPIDYITADTLKTNIRYIIEVYEPRVEIQEIDVIPNDETNEYEITLYFNIRGLPGSTSFSTTLSRTR